MYSGTSSEKLVFISYSKGDREIVLLATRLLRAGGAKVFLDINDIEYGDRWEDALVESLSRCDRVLVFWSATASKSIWVTREWRLALKLKKRIVPIPLDDTPLPVELASFLGMTELKDLLLSIRNSGNPLRSLGRKLRRLNPFYGLVASDFFSHAVLHTVIAAIVYTTVTVVTMFSGIAYWFEQVPDYAFLFRQIPALGFTLFVFVILGSSIVLGALLFRIERWFEVFRRGYTSDEIEIGRKFLKLILTDKDTE